MEILLTGFPGFIGEQLLRYAARQPAFPRQRWWLAVHPAMLDKARQTLERLALPRDRWRLMAADITQENLGLDAASLAELRPQLQMVFHLAAFYDLAGERELSHRINVEGTRHVLAFARSCPRMQKLNYVSTCFVAGECEGWVGEDDLNGTRFYNHYESTKFEAERELRRDAGALPYAIFRPAVVVGDSRTGEAAKYDGPMIFVRFLQQWGPLLRLLPAMPRLGFPDSYVNTVPVDVVVRALYHGGVDTQMTGCFQLADAAVPTTEELYQFLVRTVLGRGTFPLPRLLRHLSLKLLGFFPLTLLTGMPRTTLDYFFYRGRFKTDNFQRLCRAHGIQVPRFSDFYPRLVEFAQNNKRPFPNQLLELRHHKWKKLSLLLKLAALVSCWWSWHGLWALVLIWLVDFLFQFRLRQSREG